MMLQVCVEIREASPLEDFFYPVTPVSVSPLSKTTPSLHSLFPHRKGQSDEYHVSTRSDQGPGSGQLGSLDASHSLHLLATAIPSIEHRFSLSTQFAPFIKITMSAEDDTQNGYEDGMGGPGAPTSLSALEVSELHAFESILY
jgi:hypothetical protein